VSDAYRKLRGTLRFLLGNLSDFDPARDAVPYAQLPAVDRYVLARLAAVTAGAAASYEAFQFRSVFQALMGFVSAELSAFYLDAAKDRVYVQSTDCASRRACQTVQYALLRVRFFVFFFVCAFVRILQLCLNTTKTR
jgi:isoleucyl-tRNA synthetase